MPKFKSSQLIKPLVFSTVIVLFALAGAVLFNQEVLVNAAQQGTVVTLVPPEQVRVGETITVKLVVHNANNLAGFQSTVNYDASHLYAAGAIMDTGLGQSGRDIMPSSPLLAEGSVIVGAGTCPVADCSDSQFNTATRIADGVDGYVELVKLELIANAPGSYELSLQDVQLVDPQGNQLGAATANAVLEVSQ